MRIAERGFSADGQNVRTATYSPNLLNQYNQRDVSASVDIMGYAPAGTVTLTNNGNTHTAYRFACFFQDLWTWANTAAAQYQSVAILLDGQAYDGRWHKPGVFLFRATGQRFLRWPVQKPPAIRVSLQGHHAVVVEPIWRGVEDPGALRNPPKPPAPPPPP